MNRRSRAVYSSSDSSLRFLRKSAAAASSRKKKREEKEEEEKNRKTQQCHVLLHHWIGLEDSGPTSDEESHMPLGCVPFCWAQLGSMHPCNYLYCICEQGITWSVAPL